MSCQNQNVFEWDDTAIHLTPRWTKEPSTQAIESVCRQRLGIPSADPCDALFYAGDAMHKLYSVVYAGQSLWMKVLLPVYPQLKTRGEAATLQWVRDHTSVSVPKVVAFEDSNNNDPGFEWILLDAVSGVPAHRRWRTLETEQKIAIVQRLAEFQAELSCYGKPEGAFRNIGTLDLDIGKGEPGIPKTVIPSRLVSYERFMGGRLNYDVPRGPFRSSHDWLHAGLSLVMLEKTAAIDQGHLDSDDLEDAEHTRAAAQRLLSLLPKVFPPGQEDATATALYHDGLALHNILLDDQGNITALIDRECISAMPIWVATMLPRFLCGQIREEAPKKDMYSNITPGPAVPGDHKDPDELNNEGKDELYWIHLMEYDTTQLRRVYRARMRQLWPEWPVEESCKQFDFFAASLQCNREFFINQVNEWADHLEQGDSI